jgi:nucleotide sugar dehydrogenase
MRIVVVGGGKMGLPLACRFAHRGATVTVCDRSREIVERINRGVDPHNEPEQAEYVRAGVGSGRLRASEDTSRVVAQADAVVILVSALLTAEHDIDWRNLVDASAAVAKGLRKGMLVSYETTVPVGGCRRILAPILEGQGLKAGPDFFLVFSPERVKSRSIFAHLGHTPKVVGGIDAASAREGTSFYTRWLGAPVFEVESLEAAEFVKLAGMIYRDVNIALANELGLFAEGVGIDIWPILRAANTDGETALLEPGIGVGGHCTPVYPYFLINDAARRGIQQQLAALGRRINERQPERQIERLNAALGSLNRRRVHILGLAFRPQVSEDAFSPALVLQERLRQVGAAVTIEDPLYDDAALAKKGFTPGRIDGNSVDAVVLHTAHPEFARPDFAEWRAKGIRAVLDGRAFWSRSEAEAAGLIYVGVGIGGGDVASARPHDVVARRQRS